MKKRDYNQEVTERIKSLPSDFQKQIIAEVSYSSEKHPLYCVMTPKTNSSNVLISGGIHGDEIAGVYACLEFLEKHAQNYKDLRFITFPCINPTGFELDRLENYKGLNLNRLFGTDSKEPEIKSIENFLKKLNLNYLFTMDFHEVDPEYEGEGFTKEDNPTECYIYETQEDKSKRIGRKIINELPSGTEVCDWPEIYGDKNNKGVVSYPESCGNPIYAEATTFDGYLNSQYTDHSFTTETPLGWSLEKRVATHLSFLLTALNHYS